ncbi:MAG: glucoamylase family protein [Rhodanobacter sp.]
MGFQRLRSFLVPFVLALAVTAIGIHPLVAQDIAATASHHAPLAFDVLPGAQQAQLDELEHRTFEFFWDTANPANGLAPDHWPGQSFSSIAAVGFGLTAYGIGVERGWISRDQAVNRTLVTLRFFADAPQNASEDGATGYRGFYYHFLDMQTGLRDNRRIELSSIDTTLLLGGVLFAQSYYDRDTPQEKEIRQLTDTLYKRVDWTWMQARPPLVSMGWTPGGKFIPQDWGGDYNEASLLYILALGSPTHPLKPAAWAAWTRTHERDWGTLYGETFLTFGPLFGHQYSAAWVDLRGIRDGFMRRHDSDYFQNGRRATQSQRNYAIANPAGWTGYGNNLWGLSASSGPGYFGITTDGHDRQYFGYAARGVGLRRVVDDGTIAPTAALGSIAFAPDIVVPEFLHMKERYGKYIYAKYGFRDAFNLTLHDTGAPLRSGIVIPGFGWVDNEYLGIDQGPILLMLENWRSGLVWRVMRGNPYVRKGLQQAGFRGGWLEQSTTKSNATKVKAEEAAMTP